MSNKSILAQDVPSECFITGAFVRTSANGNTDQVSVQFKQAIAREARAGSNNALLSLAQGSTIRNNTTIASTNFSFSRAQFMKLIAPAMGVTELPEATNETQWIHQNLELSAKELLGMDVNIEITESPYANPFAPNQTMQTNPSKGTVVVPLDANGDVLIDEATQQEVHGFYRHTELVTEEPQQQFIGQYNVVGRKYGRQTQARLSAAAQATTTVAVDVPVSVLERVGG